ncbi:PIN domain-containing protein [Picosynechococcus sp. NKBG15041c]|uniref:PIN domain-containing protein n=1 Tax=Picosynechococcus sp. NKBG15041c TaxID=1407650 RepID=UPI00040374DF|nr:PIN domain-containing protein [Picosynechococcus sp. NKBG15041c]
MARTSRWCLDLNIWCASLLADLKGSQGSACQTLVDIVRKGHYQDTTVDLVISWGMLNRLKEVLLRLGIENNLATGYVDVIRAYCDLNPSLTLGGTGVIPLQDEEDRHVLETALAGGADILVTANFKDFLGKETEIVIPERHYCYFSPHSALKIVHPYLMVEWLRSGIFFNQI